MSFQPDNLDPYASDPNVPPSAAADKTKLPAVFLIVVAGLNILASCYLLFVGVAARSMRPEVFQEQMKANPFGNVDELEKQGWTPVQVQQLASNIYLGAGILGIILAVIIIIASIRMLQLRSYGLAVTGSVLAMIPCLSVMACCGVGEAVGIWALVVLLSSDVKAAFR